MPDLEGERLDAVAPVLAIETADLEEFDPYAEQFPYQVGRRVLIPAMGGPFAASSDATLYWQVYVPDTRTEPLFLAYTIRGADDEVLLDRRLRVEPETRDERGLVEAYTTITLIGFEPGDYTVHATIEGEPRLTYEMPMAVVADDQWVRPYVHALRHPPATGVETTVGRARTAAYAGANRRGDRSARGGLAARSRPGRRPQPADRVAYRCGQALRAGGRWYVRALVDDPNDPRLLRLMADVQAELGQHYDAIRYYERARLAGTEETPELLNALASEYYAEGNVEKARELFERSLEIDGEQPQVRRLLDEVLAGSD